MRNLPQIMTRTDWLAYSVEVMGMDGFDCDQSKIFRGGRMCLSFWYSESWGSGKSKVKQNENEPKDYIGSIKWRTNYDFSQVTFPYPSRQHEFLSVLAYAVWETAWDLNLPPSLIVFHPHLNQHILQVSLLWFLSIPCRKFLLLQEISKIFWPMTFDPKWWPAMTLGSVSNRKYLTPMLPSLFPPPFVCITFRVHPLTLVDIHLAIRR